MKECGEQLDLFDNSPGEQLSREDGRPPEPPSAPPKLEESWLQVLGEEFDKPYMKTLKEFLIEEKKKSTVYPAGKNMFNAFWYTPFTDVRVVILGQDPYHGEKQAHGLCFSVPMGVHIPPSLNNIFRELGNDLSIPVSRHGCLESWARQGVFLLNTVLSVRAGQAHSHAGKGWEIFTDTVIAKLNSLRENLVFVLWGRPAQSKIRLIDPGKHCILTAPHPSPLSAHSGFFGCGHFSKVNDYLTQTGQESINWEI